MALILAIAALVFFNQPASAQSVETYAAIVDQYIAGDASGAVRRLAPSTARLPGDVVSRARTFSDRQVRAAVMMHTELAAAWLVSGQPATAPVQVGNAQTLLGILTEDTRRRASSQTFAIRWYAFATSLYAAQGLFDLAYRVHRDGLIAFPGAPDLYVALGTVNEARAGVDRNGGYLNARDLSSNGVRRLLEAAASDYERALSADATLAGAHLHRGWVLHRLADRRASQELEAALERATDDGTRYLAHMFLGAVAEEGRDLERARREFEAALAIGAHQASFVALSRVETALGHTERARALAVEYAQRTDKLEDPWWDYRLGGFINGGLTWLREEARRP